MFRHALKEVRYHPGRIIATVIAIMISTAFMSAASVSMKSISTAIGRQQVSYVAAADATLRYNASQPNVRVGQILDVLNSDPNVADYDVIEAVMMPLESTRSGKTEFVNLTSLPKDGFTWGNLVEGRWPNTPQELAVPKVVADNIDLQIGDTSYGMKVVGFTDLPRSNFGSSFVFKNDGHPFGRDKKPGEIAENGPGSNTVFLIKFTDGISKASAIDGLRPKLEKFADLHYEEHNRGSVAMAFGDANTVEGIAVDEMTYGTNVITYVFWAFGLIALFVGAIIIANTFQVLVEQRRRQIGLLRTLGASRSQIRRQLLAEAMIIGLLGSLLGVVLGILIGAGVGWYTGTLVWGLSVPLGQNAIVVGFGVLVTVIASNAPVNRATRIAPLEALRPYDPVTYTKKTAVVRTVIVVIFAILAVALIAMSYTKIGYALLWAIAGAGCLSIAVLIGAQLYLPSLLRMIGGVLGRFSPTARLAAANTVRHPKRSAATGVALMLAVGLIVTLQVGTATVERTAIDAIKKEFPVDIQLKSGHSSDEFDDPTKPISPSSQAITEAELHKIDQTPNIKAKAKLESAYAAIGKPGSSSVNESSHKRVYRWNPDIVRVNDLITEPAAGVAYYTSGDYRMGPNNTLTLRHGNRSVEVKMEKVKYLAYDEVLVGQQTFDELFDHSDGTTAVWMSMDGYDKLFDTMNYLIKNLQQDGISMDGSAMYSWILQTVLYWITVTMTVMLGVAVLVALVGVANTLSLSVIERQRESALLRALGMQKSSLRIMLMIEALMIVLVGVVIGAAAGAFFGWLGVSSGIRTIKNTTDDVVMNFPVHFAVHWWLTLGLIAIAAVAAVIASLAPGRRAANASPTEALAIE